MKPRCKGRILLAGVIGAGCALGGAAALGSGFQLQEQSASGLGVAYSGMAAATQDASTAFWNPAGMSFLPGSNFSVAVHYLLPSFQFESAGPAPAGSTYNAFGNGGDAGVSSVVPALYGKMDLGSRWALGMAVNAPFGLSTEWNNQWAGMFHAVKSEVETLNINPTLSYKVNDVLSVGVGVSYQRLKATLTNAVSPLVPTARATVDGSDWAFGWNAGVLADFGQGTRVGLTYRAAASYTVDGDLSFNNPAFSALGSNINVDVRLPRSLSIALSQRLGPRLRALVDYSWTGWDSIQALTVVATSGAAAGQAVSTTDLNFQNSWRAGLGFEYQASPAWMLRAGIAYDRSAVRDAFRTPRLPDNDRKWLAAGAKFAPDDRWSLDIGYAYLWVKDAPSELAPAGPVPGALRGTYESNTSILGVQGSYRF